VCDADLRILTTDARFIGSSHNSHVHHESGLDTIMERVRREDNCWLLAYAHLPWLMEPLPQAPPCTPECRYNNLHGKCRKPVERRIGVFRQRS
ncbi:Putative nuclease, partial [Frankliniella fusca]